MQGAPCTAPACAVAACRCQASSPCHAKASFSHAWAARVCAASMACSASSFSEAMRMGAEVYHNLKNIIKDKYGEL